LAICGLALFVYARSLFCGFVRDDHAQIVQNSDVQSWAALPHLLVSHLWNQQPGDGTHNLFYRPLFSVWMLAMHTVGGIEPWFWHLGNVLLHVLATWLVFRLCLRLTGSEAGAAAGAAIFAVHPIHVDAVTWVSASSEVLFTVFAIGALLVLLHDKPASPMQLWSSAALFCGSVFSKETGFAFLPILIAVAWLRLGDPRNAGSMQRLWKASLPYLTACFLYVVARGAATDRVRAGNGEHSWAEVFYSSPSILLFYLKKLILPLGLSPSYMNPITTGPTMRFWFELLGFALGLAFAVWIAAGSHSWAGLGFAWIVLPILPALVVLRLYPEGDMTSDRYLYASSVGLSILAAIVVRHFWSRGMQARRIALGVAGALVVFFTGMTFAQQKYYKDDFAYYSRAIQVNPKNAPAYSALGDLYLDQGDVDMALENHRKAHELAPEDARLTLLLARALFATKRYSEAEALLNGVVRDPQLPTKRRVSALLSLANVEIELHNLEAAQALLDQIEKDEPNAPDLHWTKGVLFQREGLLREAQAEYEHEYRITGDPAAHRQAMLLAQKNGQSPASQPNSP
jgi:tetratricopeptide (TPR) repeat protein